MVCSLCRHDDLQLTGSPPGPPQTTWQDVQGQPCAGLSTLQTSRLHYSMRYRGHGSHNIHLQSDGDSFQMQRSTNCSMPLPFSTVAEAARLRHAYNMANTRGYPSVPALNALVRQMGVVMKDIKSWFAEERKAQGNAGNGSTTPTERPPDLLADLISVSAWDPLSASHKQGGRSSWSGSRADQGSPPR